MVVADYAVDSTRVGFALLDSFPRPQTHIALHDLREPDYSLPDLAEGGSIDAGVASHELKGAEKRTRHVRLDAQRWVQKTSCRGRLVMEASRVVDTMTVEVLAATPGCELRIVVDIWLHARRRW